jgi:hypothetical protein
LKILSSVISFSAPKIEINFTLCTFFEKKVLYRKTGEKCINLVKIAKKGVFMTKMGEGGKGKGERGKGRGVKFWKDFAGN